MSIESKSLNNFDISLIRLSKLMFLLIPLSLVIGPAPSDIIISLLGIFFIFFSIKFNLYHFYKNKFFIIFFIFCCYLIINSLFSENIFLSLESSLFYFRFGLFSLCVIFLIEFDKKIINQFFYSLLITLTIVICDGFIQFFFDFNSIGIERPNEFRLTGFFDEERILGSYVARLTPLLLALFIYSDNYSKYKVISLYLFLVLADIIVYLSGERTSFFLISLATVLFLLSVSKFRFIRLIAFISSIMVIVFITALSPNMKERMIDKPLESSNILSDEENLIFSKSHNEIYKSAFEMFLDKPIFGHGPKMFREKCLDYYYSIHSCNTHPHNTYLQLLSETGILGFLFIFIIFILISFIIIKQTFINMFYSTSKKLTISNYQICLYITIFLSLWPFSPSFNFFNNYISIIYFLPIGFILHEMKIFNFNLK